MEYVILFAVTLVMGVAIGGALGGIITHLYSKERMARLQAQHESDVEKIAWTANSERHLRETFEALAAKSLRDNAQDFSQRVEHQLGAHAGQIDVIKTALETNINQLEKYVRDLEVKRASAYSSLSEHVVNLENAHKELRTTTEQLVNALRSGPIRGRWGEIQLRKIVELSGMSEHVSFVEQVSGGSGRPDMVVYLPNQGQIAVDSKFPLQAFLEAMASTDTAIRKEKLEEHTKVLKQTIHDLSRRNYWKEFDPSPELVILFIPIESCLMVAFECDPGIIEFALEHKIILASPITLLGFMKSIAYGWQQFVISKNAKIILKQAKELHDRIDGWLGHFRDTGTKMEKVVEAYNKCVVSLESRFFPTCRKFEELSALAEEIAEVEMISKGVQLPPESDGTEELQESAGIPLPAQPLVDDLPKPALVTVASVPSKQVEDIAVLPSDPSETTPSRLTLRGLRLVVIWEAATSSEKIVSLIENMDLWRALHQLGCQYRKIEVEAIDSNGNLIVDESGWRPIVEKTGLPILLFLDGNRRSILHHFRLPETMDEVINLVLDTVRSST